MEKTKLKLSQKKKKKNIKLEGKKFRGRGGHETYNK